MSQELFMLSTSFNSVSLGDERIVLRFYYKYAAM